MIIIKSTIWQRFVPPNGPQLDNRGNTCLNVGHQRHLPQQDRRAFPDKRMEERWSEGGVEVKGKQNKYPKKKKKKKYSLKFMFLTEN